MPDSFAFIQILLQPSRPEGLPAKIPLTKAALVLSALIRSGRGQSRKYSEQVNIITSDITFLKDKFDVFINKNANA